MSENEGTGDEPKVIEHKADKPAAKTASRAKAPRKQKAG
jgi:hypothetical protein